MSLRKNLRRLYEVQCESGETEWLTEKSVKNLGTVAREWVRDYDEEAVSIENINNVQVK